MASEVAAITEKVRAQSALVNRILTEVGKALVGQKHMIERLLIGLLSNGHILLEGVPGLAKTLSVRSLASSMEAHYQRIQFTPDLLPADVLGTMIFNQKTGEFTPKKGPVFTNILLADEINRAPAKVQSALLESMQERQVTIGNETYHLPEPFLVLATQNPIEQEGTYPLPEAQVDRFMLKVVVTYPDKDEERRIIDLMTAETKPEVGPVVNLKEIEEAREIVRSIYLDPKIRDYIVDIVFATRHPEKENLTIAVVSEDGKTRERAPMERFIQYGASPRASIYLTQAAKAHAFLQGRGHVLPEDVKAVGLDVLRHRVIPTYEAEALSLSPEALVQSVFDQVEVP